MGEGLSKQQSESTHPTLKIQNDILSALNDGSAVIVLLDLSAVFDTIDHQILLSRLHNMYVIRGDAHNWFNGYLSDRTQHGVLSDSKKLTFVPQGFVHGPTFVLLVHQASF